MPALELWEFAVPGGRPVAAMLLLALGAVVGWSVAGMGPLAPTRRALLVGLRLLSALGLWVVASQPRYRDSDVELEPGRLAVAVDVSRSMSVASAGQPRYALVRQLLERGRLSGAGGLLALGAALRPIDEAELLEPGTYRDDASALSAELVELAEGPLGEGVGGVLLVSDGADDDRTMAWDPPNSNASGGAPAPRSALLDRLRDSGLRVHTLAIAPEREVRDDALARVEADSVAFLREPARIRVTVRRLGASGPVPVAILEGEQIVREATAVPDANGEAVVTLEVTPRRLGRALYRVSIPLEEGDAVPENNERAVLLNVVRSRLRVLLVAGRPSWDVRFLRSFLERDPSVDLISFFILRSTSDLTMANPDELALIPFPTDELFREHLGSFDVVLFQNFDYGPYQMGAYLPRIRSYVRRGGSFAMVGGDRSFASGEYADTAVADILPVELPATGEARVIEGEFRPSLVPDTQRHPLVALHADSTRNLELWRGLAPVHGANRVTGLREHGQVLLRHPGAQAAPVLVAAEVGEGRVMALTIDESWRWGFATAGTRGDATAYDRFWDRALRWLGRDPSLEPVQVETDRDHYGPDARVRVRARLADRRYRPWAGQSVEVALLGADARELSTREIQTDGEGALELELAGPADPGAYQIRVRARANDGEEPAPTASIPFVVEAGGDELADPRPDPDYLRRVAQAAGGRFFASPEELPELDTLEAVRLRRQGAVLRAPFASPFVVLGLGLVFALEWWIRRRWGQR